MGVLVYTVLGLLLAVAAVECITVEAKLDFQSEKQDKPKLLDKVLILQKNEEKRDDHGDVKLVCGGEGCNTTNVKLEGSDTNTADIVIQVKTNVNTSNGKNKTIEEVPDVPIVLGYGGAGNVNPEENAINQNPLYSPSLDRSYSDVRNGNGFVPSLGVPQYTPFNDRGYKTVRYDYDTPSDRYLPPTPQYDAPRRYGVVFNPLGPNRVPQPDWKSSAPWHVGRHYGYNNQRPYHKPTTTYPWTQCTCLNQNPGWRPTTSNPLFGNSNPGSSINDKLAPLN